MTDNEITYEQARKLILEVIAEKGKDYIGSPDSEPSTCVYFDDLGQPSCIIGHILPKLGISRQDLVFEKEDDYYGPTEVDLNYETGAMELLPRLGIKLDTQAQDYLRLVQSQQDQGMPWGDADIYASHYVEEEYDG